MAVPCSRNGTDNFNCVLIACVDIIQPLLADILNSQITPKDLFNRINSCQALLSGNHKLYQEQRKICYLKPPTDPDYERFDTSLLYTLIRNLCHSLTPTKGWGIKPESADINKGDDIERLRAIRNRYQAHHSSSEISNTEFQDIWNDLKSVINRIRLTIKCSVDYEQKLIDIESGKRTKHLLESYKLLLEAHVNLKRGQYFNALFFIICIT